MDKEVKSQLIKLLKEDAKVVDGRFEREIYSRDIGDIPFVKLLFDTLPIAIVQPRNIDGVRTLLKFADDEHLPVFTRGRASSGLGGAIPTEKGVVLDLSLMRRIIGLSKEGETPTIDVEAGVRWSDIADTVKSDGLALSVYPSSFFSSVGGWIATGGYGIGSFMHGHLSEQVESIEVVLPGGEIKRLSHQDTEFYHYFETEGQFGVVVSARLKLKETCEEIPRLLYFESPVKAFEFIEDLIKRNIQPYHLKFLDQQELHETNLMMGEEILKECDAVLISFDSHKEVERFAVQFGGKINEAESYLASLLWHERFFPMKKKVLGPTLLANEVILPLAEAASFMKAAKEMAKRFGANISIESHIISKNETLVISNILCDSRSFFPYLSKMSLVPILTRLAIKNYGGRPYGVGIWNTPFLNAKFNHEMIMGYKTYKERVDPNNILNPSKFFRIRSRMANIPAIGFNPLLFILMLSLARVSAPLLGVIKGKEVSMPSSYLERAALVCSRCGSCAAVCPAHFVREDKRLTPRSKLILAEKIFKNEEILPDDANSAFLCMHCGLCEEVCQNELKLVLAWEELEDILKCKYGVPTEIIEVFIRDMEGSETYWRLVDA